jgi:uncharacterized protein (DUF58 family)
VVYPRPDPSAGPPPQSGGSDAEEGIPVAGDDEFNMLRAYRAGDAPKLIAWKALAREQGLLTKEFNATASAELWLEWNEAPGVDVEGKLAALAHWVLKAEDYGQAYGLRIPGVRILPDRGEPHCRRCLEALALFQAPQ